jgi:hypothetical protein
VSRYPKHGLCGASPADFTWLEGRWEARIGDDVMEECWTPLRGNMLIASFRWVRGDGSVHFYEIEVIEQAGEHVYLRVKHFDTGLVGWEEREQSLDFLLVEHDEQGAVFYEQDVPDPRWTVYRRDGPDELRAYFTHDEAPDPDPGVFEFHRV